MGSEAVGKTDGADKSKADRGSERRRIAKCGKDDLVSKGVWARRRLGGSEVGSEKNKNNHVSTLAFFSVQLTLGSVKRFSPSSPSSRVDRRCALTVINGLSALHQRVESAVVC